MENGGIIKGQAEKCALQILKFKNAGNMRVSSLGFESCSPHQKVKPANRKIRRLFYFTAVFISFKNAQNVCGRIVPYGVLQTGNPEK
ncbi:hypothetical protein [Flavobacterium panacis]|uniref:hypothetical protein n=1 Tax=Flavobacterium panacis TaxID=2962567 RepID=UPI00214E5B3F|nr:hypothetical protein [Flavobacterium panacis]